MSLGTSFLGMEQLDREMFIGKEQLKKELSIKKEHKVVPLDLGRKNQIGQGRTTCVEDELSWPRLNHFAEAEPNWLKPSHLC